MTSKSHWESVHNTKASDQVSWYQLHLNHSLEFILQSGIAKDMPIIDVGAGSSTLVDDLLASGFTNITVLDISAAALHVAKVRLGERANQVTWIEADITSVSLPQDHYAFWHDRAVFHFLTKRDDRQAYMSTLRQSVKNEGDILVSTFALNGPEQCSGLNVIRFSPEELQVEFNTGFQVVKCDHEEHQTPFGTIQPFVYCHFKRQAV
jgi:2-polyprenyl-3-methyl-5-hydroxy-6-metoxy-1,4-benzoquinol methylase